MRIGYFFSGEWSIRVMLWKMCKKCGHSSSGRSGCAYILNCFLADRYTNSCLWKEWGSNRKFFSHLTASGGAQKVVCTDVHNKWWCEGIFSLSAMSNTVLGQHFTQGGLDLAHHVTPWDLHYFRPVVFNQTRGYAFSWIRNCRLLHWCHSCAWWKMMVLLLRWNYTHSFHNFCKKKQNTVFSGR